MKKITFLICFSTHLSTSVPYHVVGKESHLLYKSSLIVLVSLFSIRNSEATTSSYGWNKEIEGARHEWGNALDVDRQGNFRLGGGIASYGHGKVDGFFAYYNSEGQRTKVYTFGDEDNNELLDLKMYPDDASVTGGYTEKEGDFDFLITTFDMTEMDDWQKAFGAKNGTEKAYSIYPCLDGSAVATGFTNSSIARGMDSLTMRIAPDGNEVIYAVTVGTVRDDYGYGVVATENCSAIVTGSSVNVNGDMDAFFFMLDSMGEKLLWDYTQGGNEDDAAYDIALFNETFWWIGMTMSLGVGGKDIWIGQNDLFGTPIQLFTLGGNGDDIGKRIDIALNGKMSIIADMDSFGGKHQDIWIGHLNADGWLNTSRITGGTGYERAGDVVCTPDGKSAGIGDYTSDGSGYSNLLFVKFLFKNKDCGSLVTPIQEDVTANLAWSWQNASFSRAPFNGTLRDADLKITETHLTEDTTNCHVSSEPTYQPSIVTPTQSQTPAPLIQNVLEPTSSPTMRPTKEDTSLSRGEIMTITGLSIGIVGLGCWMTFWYCSCRKSEEVKKDIDTIQQEGRELKQEMKEANIVGSKSEIEEISYEKHTFMSKQDTMNEIRAFNMIKYVK